MFRCIKQQVFYFTSLYGLMKLELSGFNQSP